ncbi:MAG: hypothetical protein KKC76_19005 [Proteobacteria bacterium]|nr:hypothetical protein [Pseudomonadota bacterium]MBU4296860.1 hypothetical protein [Pseudomonadota bacterium]
MTGLCVRIIYYPPYHSKYNSIERYWAGFREVMERIFVGYSGDCDKTSGQFHLEGATSCDAAIRCAI